MQQQRWRGRRVALLPLLLLAVLMLMVVETRAFAGTATAYAQSSTTLTFANSGTLIARTTVQIAGTASCILPEGAILESVGLTVNITQASGREIVQGVGGVSLTMACDGTAHPFQAFVTPPAGSAPFHGGAAIVTGTLSVVWIDAAGFFHEDRLSSDPATIKLNG